MFEGPNKPFFEAVLANPPLWSSMLDFEHRLREDVCGKDAGGALEGDVEELWAALLPWLAKAPEWARIPPLCTTALFWDFTEESSRCALLPDTLLSNVAALLGVTFHAKAIAACILKSERDALVQALGQDLYDYALQLGQYVGGTGVKLALDWDLDAPLVLRARLHGWRALWLLAQPWPQFLREYFCARLASFVEQLENGGALALPALSLPALPSDQWASLWIFVKKCLLREVAPSWEAYFTL